MSGFFVVCASRAGSCSIEKSSWFHAIPSCTEGIAVAKATRLGWWLMASLFVPMHRHVPGRRGALRARMAPMSAESAYVQMSYSGVTSAAMAEPANALAGRYDFHPCNGVVRRL